MPEETGLRARKKAITRASIVDAAERLFEERGFDAVTVAEIADAANVSVKTLFVYFRSKEELAFADTWLIEAIEEGVRRRAPSTSPASAVADVLVTAIESGEHDSGGLDAYHRGFDSPGLRSGMLRMWSEYEDRLTSLLAEHDPVIARLQAMQAIAVVRLVVSREVFDELTKVPEDEVVARLTHIIEAAAASMQVS